MTKTSDKKILERVAGGEAGAVEECLDQYGDLVWSLARRHGFDNNDAEDAVQEIFLDLWKSAGRYDSRLGSEVTFICTLARRRLIDRRRFRQRRPQTDTLNTPSGRYRQIPDVKATTIEASADASFAVRAMSELQPNEREVLRLSVVAGMSHSEIAEHTKIPLGTVKTYIRRSLIRVHDALEARANGIDPREVTH